jgi:serine/threonine-protein kinase RsbW
MGCGMPADLAPAAAGAWGAAAEISVHLAGTALGVRAGLDRVLTHAALSDLQEVARGTLWTVLAEVLNNVVEHAYAQAPGDIQVRLWRQGATVAVEVLDRGAPMPGLQMPEGKLADLGAMDDLPEGGFGWFLIRSMTDWLTYDRIGAENRLRFCMECA